MEKLEKKAVFSPYCGNETTLCYEDPSVSIIEPAKRIFV